ncbi:DNA recombination protein RmuC [Agaribacterium haliotis]|uniref:DNA recombination protein RmuC n=1 Tax=Agaribacterium haliotis TaxID=2013869 RepID=UPI000BB55844|nr:DNA recombination protein RmuC [Agaribacterium haliotis]
MNIDAALVPLLSAAGTFAFTLVFSLLLMWLFLHRQKQAFELRAGEAASTHKALEQQLAADALARVQLQTELEAKVQGLKQMQDERERLELELDKQRSTAVNAQKQLEVSEATAKEREQSFARQLEQFETQKQSLKKEFELLAAKIFDEKGKSFDAQSRGQLDSVLKPFKEQMQAFQQRVNEVHSESLQGTTKLEAQIKHVLDVGLKMSDEAKTLASALKGDKKAQGSWSEVQAELLLEMSGLVQGREYLREASYKTEDGRDQRPDFIVNLPNDKHIIIDSKISLVAYIEATAAKTEEEQQLCMKRHVEAIRSHVKSLSEKNYAQLKGLNSPEYIFMFIGNEAAYLAAADYEPALFQEAYRKGIAIVTPNTLLSSLRIVAHLWSIDKQNANTRQLAEQAAKVYDKLRVFAEKMQKLGTQIGTVQKTYDESWNTLKDGRGSLAKQVDKFVDMGVSVKEKLPAALTEKELLDSKE